MSQSLHQVFYWHPDKEQPTGWRLVNDGFHANTNGQYLGGLVWYAFFFGQDPREVSFAPKAMTPEQAESLRKIAFETTASKQ